MSFQNVGQRQCSTSRLSLKGSGRGLSRGSLEESTCKSLNHSEEQTKWKSASSDDFGCVSSGGSSMPDVAACSSSSASGADENCRPRDFSNSRRSTPQDYVSFSHLSEDVVRFQAMVSDAKHRLRSGGRGSGCEWNATQVKSIEELGSRISKGIDARWHKLEELDIFEARSSRAELTKVQRNFQRAWGSYQEMTSKARRSGSIRGNYLSDEAVDRGWNNEQKRIVAQREEEYAAKIMQEREDEMQKINMQVHTVNEIYRDLGDLVQSQQEQIDQVEENLQTSKDRTQRGLEQVEEANRPSRWRNPFQAGLPEEKETEAASQKIPGQEGGVGKESYSLPWPKEFDALKEDMNEVHKDISSIVSDVMMRGKVMMMGCVAAGNISNSPIL